MTRVEFRDRSRRAPAGGFRLVLGEARNERERRVLEGRRSLCQRIARRGEWEVLAAIKDGLVTFEQVERLTDAEGWEDYRAHLRIERPVLAPTLDEHMQRWIGTVAKNGTRSVYSGHVSKLTDHEADGARLGSRPWPAVAEHHVQDAYAEARSSLAANTVRTMLGAWGAFFTWAVDRERSEAKDQGRDPLIVESPVRGAKVWGKPNVTRHRFFARKEFDRLLEVSAPEMAAQYATLVLTGLRIAEFMVLPPVHVKLTGKAPVISVGPWGTWVPKGYPESERGVRDVPVHRTELLPRLREYAKKWAGEAAFFVNPRSGEPWSYGAFAEQMKKDVTGAGMVYGQRRDRKPQPEGVTPHTCRHTLATWLCQADVQLVKIARLLGDTVDTIERHYAHWLPTDLDRAINGLLP